MQESPGLQRLLAMRSLNDLFILAQIRAIDLEALVGYVKII
jgi:hypothetical protein